MKVVGGFLCYSVKEFADVFNLHPSTVVKMINKKQIVAFKVGSRYFIPYQMYADLINSLNKNVVGEL